MPSTTIHTPAGASSGSVELSDELFGIQPNVPVMHQVVVAQLAHRRAGTQSTKTRAEVRGGGAKPYRQKGTGNARQGSTRSPQFSGGGIALGPKPRSYSQRTPKKMIRLALASALSDRAAEGKIVVVDSWAFETPKTKDAIAVLQALGTAGRVLVVVAPDDGPTALSFRNVPEVQLITPGELNAYDVLCNDWIVFSGSTLPGAPTSTSDAARGGSAIVESGSEASASDGSEGPATSTAEGSAADAEPAIDTAEPATGEAE